MARLLLPSEKIEAELWIKALRSFPTSDVAQRCGFSRKTWHSWLRGERAPRYDSLEVIRDFCAEVLTAAERLQVIKRTYQLGNAGKVSVVFGY